MKLQFDGDLLSPSFSPIESPKSLLTEHPSDNLAHPKKIKIKIGSMIGKSESSFLKCDSEGESELNSSGENDENSDGHSDMGDSLEEIRRQNIEAMNALLNSIRNPELENHFKVQTATIQKKKIKSPLKKPKNRKGTGDVTFR